MNLLQGRPVTGILHATRRLVIAIICAKQYFNPTTNNKVIAAKNIPDRHTDVGTDNAATICSPQTFWGA